MAKDNQDPLLAVFVYGTLMADEIVRILLRGRTAIAKEKATLDGYHRCSLAGRQYPAIIPHAGSTVEGYLLQLASEDDMNTFDEYEDEQYTREKVLVTTSEGKQEAAYVYVWADMNDPLLNRTVDWDYDLYRKVHLDRFLGAVRGYAKWVDSGKPPNFQFGSQEWTVQEEFPPSVGQLYAPNSNN